MAFLPAEKNVVKIWEIFQKISQLKNCTEVGLHFERKNGSTLTKLLCYTYLNCVERGFLYIKEISRGYAFHLNFQEETVFEME